MQFQTVFASFLLLAATTSSYSADMAPPVIEYENEISDINDWGGWYAGVQGGWNWVTAKDTSPFPSSDLEGALIGGYAGYNFAIDNVVLGLELDANYLDLEKTTTSNSQIKSEWGAGLSARFGYAFDNILPYVRAGAGLQDGYIKSLVTGISDDMTYGYVEFGGGVEAKLAEDVGLRFEVLHRITDKQKFTLNNTYKSEATDTIARAGLSFYF